MGKDTDRAPLAPSFSHTSNAVYLTAFFALCCVGYDSTHDIIQRSHINKKWFYLFGATCLFAYLYVRPLIRRRLGSASRGYINFSTIYICWLIMAVFYHLPSLESMGINIKADVSMWLTCFLGSLCTLGLLHGAYSLLVALRLLDPKLYSPMAGAREVWSIVLMNSVNLAVACSTYYSFCGNAPIGDGGSVGGGGVAAAAAAAALNGSSGLLEVGSRYSWKDAVCHKWLHPVSASSHSAFTRWVIYGEAASTSSSNSSAAAAAAVNSAGGGSSGSLLWRSPAPMAAPAPLAANDTAVGFVQIDYPLDGKGMLTIPAADLVSPIFSLWLTLLLMYAANCLADYGAAATLNAAYTADLRRELASRERRLRRHRHHRRRSADYAHDLRPAASWAASSDGGMTAVTGSEGDASSIRDAFADLASRGSFDTLLRTMSSVGHILGSPTTTMRRASSMLFRDDFGIGLATSWLHQAGGSAHSEAGDAGGPGGGEAPVPIPPDAATPSFLPMYPWYSGTSADLLKTLFDLIISVRVFLGRFDMRTMQAALAPRPSGPNAPPVGGDGFTFEHLANKEELWWDFTADTGDGGDPTYAIARCMAAPQLRVTVPPELVAAGAAGSGEGKAATATLAAGQRSLPRASVVIHGGDLCYPSPTDDTFEQRLFGPYQDAFPPPGHVHPGHLVVNKPDLGPEHWAAAAAAVASGAAAECRFCSKETALRSYDGPTLFAVPGNHDWIDGLDCFQRHIQHKGWIGGWLMPQEKSYFAVRLPHGWWIFGLDLALVDDIDMCQYSYFARIAEERMGPEDQVILVQHCPNWLVGWFWGHAAAKNLRQLIRGPLAGRARMQLAGDLHFMMRHSFQQYQHGQSPSLAPSELPTPAGGSPLGGSPLGGSPTASRLSSRSATPAPGLRNYLSPSQLHQTLVNRLGAATAGGANGNAGGSSSNKEAAARRGGTPPLPPQQQQARQAGSSHVPAGAAASGGASGVALGGASPEGASPLGCSPEQPWSSLLQDTSSTPLATPQRHGMPLPAGRQASEAAEALAALTSPGSVGSSGSTSQPITIGSKLAAAAGGRPTQLPLRSPARSSGAAGSGGMPAVEAAGSEAEAGSAALPAQVGHGSCGSMGDGGLGARRQSAPSLGASPQSGTTSPFHSWWPGLRVRTGGGGSGAQGAAAAAGGGSSADLAQQRSPSDPMLAAGVGGAAGGMRRSDASFASLDGSSPLGNGRASSGATAAGVGGTRSGSNGGWHLNDPEHLVVCGSGGAFCHPTHVFSESRFQPEYHPAAGPIYIKSPPPPPPPAAAAGGTMGGHAGMGQGGSQQQAAAGMANSGGGGGGGGGLRRSFPSGSSLYSLGHRGSEAEARRPAGGEYRCTRAFPTAEQSLKLGRSNLTFRSVNNRFDIIGGLLYYVLVISVLPRCTGVGEVLEAHTLREAAAIFARAGLATVQAILTESYISLAALLLVFAILFGLCRSGGIGALPGVPPALRRRPEFHGSTLAVRARVGGVATQLAYTTAHCLAHLCSAVSLLLLLELAIEVMIRHEGVGADGYHSLYKWFQRYEALHFPDPMGVRDTLQRYTLGLYPTVLKWAMAVFDLPESIAVSRTAMCAGGLAALTRVQAAGYYLGMLAYYWVLATPTVGFLFGCYLYISVNWFHVHYDEAFSSLQVPHFKGFCRFHITRTGDLEMFGLALERVPHAWREDPRWRTPHGGGNRDAPAHRAKYPSRWVPVEERTHMLRPPRMVPPPETQLKVVDYLLVPRYRR